MSINLCISRHSLGVRVSFHNMMSRELSRSIEGAIQRKLSDHVVSKKHKLHFGHVKRAVGCYLHAYTMNDIQSHVDIERSRPLDNRPELVIVPWQVVS